MAHWCTIAGQTVFVDGERCDEAMAAEPVPPGLMRTEVLSPLDCRDEVGLLTRWRDETSFKA